MFANLLSQLIPCSVLSKKENQIKSAGGGGVGGELKTVCSKCKKISTFRPYINIPSSLGI